MISLTLAFSPVQQDRKVSEYIQQLSIELYHHLCKHNKAQRVARLSHSTESIKLINLSLTVLSLPNLIGVVEEESLEPESHEYNQSSSRRNVSEDSGISETEGQDTRRLDKHADGRGEVETNVLCGDPKRDSISFSQSVNKANTFLESSTGDSGHQGFSQSESSKNQSSSSFKLKKEFSGTADVSEIERRPKHESTKDKTSRGWTYNFGHETRQEGNLDPRKQGCRTYPLINLGKPLDPKKQWQTYKHKCVGLPVDPNFFASPAPSYESSNELDADVSSSDEEFDRSLPLVNLSVPYIKHTVENRTKTKEKTVPSKLDSLVNREATTTSFTGSVNSSGRLFLHPHDLPNQPMKSQRDRDGHRVDEHVDVSQFAPLVDLGRITMTDLLDMGLGESISTTDTVEYMNNWLPPRSEGLAPGHRIQSKYSSFHYFTNCIVKYRVKRLISSE